MRAGSTLPSLALALSVALPAAADDLAEAARNDASIVQVRTVEARHTSIAAEIVFTGDIQAQAQTNVSFRVSGKVATRLVEVGDHVSADQVLARLDPKDQKSDLDNAKAALVSAEALLTQAKMTFERQRELLRSGYTTRPAYDNAEQQLRTTQASVDSAKAAVGTQEEQFSYTELRAGVTGIVMSRTFETGQVVQAGQTVLVLAQDGPRDAVFNVYEALPANPPADKDVQIALQADPSVATTGFVRELSPSVDTASGTVRVKIGLKRTPPAMGLGAVVIGRGQFKPRQAVVLPWSALFRWEDKPAVWIYDRNAGTVAPRVVRVDRYEPDSIALASGVADGESVVVAGIQFLRPGQTVAVAEAREGGMAR